MWKVLMSVEDDDEVTDFQNYQDIRMELNSTGHNLTSVLINPRESLLENIFDEFAADQSAPLEYDSPLTASAPSTGLFGTSSHSAASTGRSAHTSANTSTSTRGGGSSHHGSMKASSTSRYSTNGTLISSTSLYTTTPTEDRQLEQLVVRLKKIYATYNAVHRQDNHSDRYLNNHAGPSTSAAGVNGATPRKANHNASMNNLRTRSTSMDSIAETPVANKSQWSKLAGEELRTCYREVPALFFRADFSLLVPEIFNETLLIKDTLEEGGMAGQTHKKKHAPLQKGGRTYSTEDVMEMMQRQGLDGRSHDVLSYYMDLVEVALLRQIWLRSPAFFRALDDIKGLQHQVSEATHIAHTARLQLRAADDAATVDPQRIPCLSRRQRNVRLLHDKLLNVQRVVQGRTAILALLETEDYFGAMELISAAKGVYHEQLSGIVALRQLGRQLDDIDNLVCEVMCNKFVSLAIQWEDTASTAANGTAGGSSTGPSARGDDDSSGQVFEELDNFMTNGNGSGGHSSASAPSTIDALSPEPRLSMEASLTQLLQSLVLTERTQSALNMYKNRLLDAIKLIVRTCVMEYLSYFDPAMAYEDHPFDQHMGGSTAEGAGADTPFAQKVREMSGENFLSCLAMCYEHVMVSVQKAHLFHLFVERQLNTSISAAVGLDLTPDPDSDTRADTPLGSLRSNGSGNSLSDQVMPMAAPLVGSAAADAGSSKGSSQGHGSDALAPRLHSQEFKQAQVQMVATSRACLTAACDLAQRSIAQLISLRKEVNCKFVPEKMKFLWEISLNFVLSLEQVSASTAYIMRQCLLSQTKSFLDYLHETCKGKLVVTLDNERWVQCDVSAERQAELDRLSSGKAFLPLSLSQQKNHGGAHSSSGMNLSAAAGLAGAHSTSLNSMNAGDSAKRGGAVRDKESRPAVVDGVQYKVVWSVMLLTETILTYLEVAFNFSPVTADVINKIVELLRLFNSRTRQLVLGAQAIQSAARLKSISAKHLAVTGQSLGLINTLLPHIRAALLAQIPPKHQLLLTELDRVSHDLIDHHGQIVAKLVTIVGDFVDASATRLRAVDWDHFQGLQCEYFEEVQRNVLALHRVLQAVLPPAQIQDVFSRIFALLNRKIPAHFDEIMPSTPTGRQRILDEITHLVTAFSRIKQIDASALTDTLEETFRKRYMREK